MCAQVYNPLSWDGGHGLHLLIFHGLVAWGSEHLPSSTDREARSHPGSPGGAGNTGPCGLLSSVISGEAGRSPRTWWNPEPSSNQTTAHGSAEGLGWHLQRLGKPGSCHGLTGSSGGRGHLVGLGGSQAGNMQLSPSGPPSLRDSLHVLLTRDVRPGCGLAQAGLWRCLMVEEQPLQS